MPGFPATHPYTFEPDSDLESPHLSDALTETENDTPPETPSRPNMIEGTGHTQRHGLKGEATGTSGTLDMPYFQQTRSPIMPPPAQVAQPLTIATPAPIRPVLHYFRSCGAHGFVGPSDDDDGYDSENEGQLANRPALPRTRSFRLTPNSDQGRFTSSPRTGFHHRAASFAKRLYEHSPSPLSTPIPGSRPSDNATPPTTRRPHHPSPLLTDLPTLPLDPQTILSRSLGDGSTVIRGLDRVAGVETILDPAGVIHQSQTGDLTLTPEELNFLTSVSVGSPSNVGLTVSAPENRRDETVGLGLGLPTGLNNVAWNEPIATPIRSDGSESNVSFPSILPEWLQTPDLAPIPEDDSDMSPLELSMPLIPSSGESLHWAPLSLIDASTWSVSETGIRDGIAPATARIV